MRQESNLNARYRKPECHQKDLNFVVNREPLEVLGQRGEALDPNVGKSLFFLDPLLIPFSRDTYFCRSHCCNSGTCPTMPRKLPEWIRAPLLSSGQEEGREIPILSAVAIVAESHAPLMPLGQ